MTVYFILDSVSNAVKIGTTTNLDERFNSLQNNSPNELKVIHLLTGHHTQEASLHRLFKADRLNGEWFRYSNAIKQWLANPVMPADPPTDTSKRDLPKVICVRLNDETLRRLESLKDHFGMTSAEIARKALNLGLEEEHVK